MGNFTGLQRRIFPHSNQPKAQKISAVLPEQADFSVHSSPFWFGHSPPRVYKGGQRSETDGTNKGYPNPPVPGRLVAECPVPGNLPTTYSDPLGPLPTVGMGGQHEEIRVRTPASLQFRRLPVRPIIQSSPTHSGPVDSSAREIKFHQEPEQLYSQTVHVIDRTAYSHRKASLVGTSLYEAHPVALETPLACPRGARKDHTSSPFSPSTPKLVVGRAQHSEGPAITPSTTRSSTVYRHLKRRLGRTIRGNSTARGAWSTIESRLQINFLELKAVLLALKSFELLCRDQIFLVATDNTTMVSYINKQGGMKSGFLCALLWRLLSWCHPRGIVLRARHIPGRLNVIADKLSRHNQVIQTEWSLSQEVFNLLCSRWASSFVCKPVQSQSSPVCITGTGPSSLGSRCPESSMGGYGRVRFSSNLSDQPSDFQGDGSGLSQDDSHCSRVAKHALVLGPGEVVGSDPLQSSPTKGPRDSTIQRPGSQESQQSESTCFTGS